MQIIPPLGLNSAMNSNFGPHYRPAITNGLV